TLSRPAIFPDFTTPPAARVGRFANPHARPCPAAPAVALPGPPATLTVSLPRNGHGPRQPLRSSLRGVPARTPPLLHGRQRAAPLRLPPAAHQEPRFRRLQRVRRPPADRRKGPAFPDGGFAQG